MKGLLLLLSLLSILLLIFPVAATIFEEDWGNYTHIDEKKRNGDGKTVTLNYLRRNYTNDDGKYTIAVRDFDAQGKVVLDISFMGRQETIILKGEWDAGGNMIYTPPVKLFNNMMTITTNKIVPPAGIFTCCPEAEIRIDLIRPELFIEFNNDTNQIISYEYVALDPFGNWTENPVKNETITDNGVRNSYHINERIPVGLIVTNYGDAESTDNVVYVDTDGLIIENGKAYYQLPELGGKNQQNLIESSSETINMSLRFPSLPEKIDYSIHAYVRGKKEGITYYYDTIRNVTLLPSVNISKSATPEAMMPDRQEVERIYRSIYGYNKETDINRWLEGDEIFVSIGVTNYQNYGIKGLRLKDLAGSQFSVDNQSLDWTFDLKPFESREFKYRVKALRPGTLKHPSAQLLFFDLNRTWSLQSRTPFTEVHGPCIQVFKKPDRPVIFPGGNTTVTVTIRNSGDMPSKVRINDTIPENSTFMDGVMDYEGVLLPRDSAIISYNISIKAPGQLELDPPGIYINGMKESGCGEPILSEIMVREPTQLKNFTMPVKTSVGSLTSPPVHQLSLLEGLIPAFLLILAITVLIILHRTNK
ncbi:Uncharacterised protein [uncultured archaeon]|nr:Uncharacterised protein [uncultured archaeon]